MKTIVEREMAYQDMWCGNCLELGIQDPTIIRGSEYMKVKQRRNLPRFGLKIRLYCLDCWNNGGILEEKDNEYGK